MKRLLSILILGSTLSIFAAANVSSTSYIFKPAEWFLKPGTSILSEGYQGSNSLLIRHHFSQAELEAKWYSYNYGTHSKNDIPVDFKKHYNISIRGKGQGSVWFFSWCYNGDKHLGNVTFARKSFADDYQWEKVAKYDAVFPDGTNRIKIVFEFGAPTRDVIDLKLSDLVLEEAVPPADNTTVYVIPAISNQPVLPDTVKIDGQRNGTIRIFATPGEFEPGSFAVRAGSLIKSLKVEVSPLVSSDKKNRIPASAVDIRIVKPWYIGGWNATVYYPGTRILAPELLLKDASLVKTNPVEKDNYLKLRFPTGDKYVCVSKAEGEEYFGIQKGESRYLDNAEYPVKDTETLQPLDIPAATSQQFWVTVKIPEDAVSGDYAGTIRLNDDSGMHRSIPLQVKVLPFKLLPPYYTSSIYYKGALGGNGSISAGNYWDSKNELQFRREMENLRDHGVNNPPIFMAWNQAKLDEKTLAQTLKIRQTVGMDNTTLFFWGSATGAQQTPEALTALQQHIKKVIDFTKQFGTKKVYFYGIDEAVGDRLKKQRPAWQAVHKAGGYVYVAGNKTNYDAMGDIQDILVMNEIVPGEAAKWHNRGGKLFAYGDPQCGVEKPETYRRNYGLRLWQNDYDGAMDHAYQCAYGNIYNDFDAVCRDEVMAYPTVNGVIDTIEWEGYREGVDDVRYLTTLQAAINQAEKSGSPQRMKVADKAKAYLAQLKKADLFTIDLDQTRRQIVDYILKLSR